MEGAYFSKQHNPIVLRLAIDEGYKLMMELNDKRSKVSPHIEVLYWESRNTIEVYERTDALNVEEK